MKVRALALVLSVCCGLSLCACGKGAGVKTSGEVEEVSEVSDVETVDDYNGYNKRGEYLLKIGDLIGFKDCYALGEMSPYDYCSWDIYNGDHVMIASQFGFGSERGPLYFVKDIDGDGKDELICNCIYSGDGAVRAFIYRNNNGVPEVGCINEDLMSERVGADLYVLAYDFYYDDELGDFIFLHYPGEGEEVEYRVGIEEFVFSRFDPEHTF